MRLKPFFVWLGLVWVCQSSFSQEASRAQQIEKIEAELKWTTGRVVLGNNLAEVNLTSSYRYLGSEDARKVIVDIWGNPPSRRDTLGMIFPADVEPAQPGGWAVVLTYKEDGYVKDDDAAKINYDDLLKQMQEAVERENQTRVKQNFSKVELVGWAASPRYDQQSHKLYWAKEFDFGGGSVHTLNYDVRVLGRKGVLAVNAVASMSQLTEIQERMPEIISMVNFLPGSRYADYQQGNDKVAAYGLAALVLGGVAAKAGLFKGLIALILAGKKFIILAAIAVGGFFVRFFRKFKKSKTESLTDPGPSGPLLGPPNQG
ncbi:MAG: DUF2167 domain-containing protein [Verrucomicrobia bacterium]|nr:DUF2167 domain-containing protein [Verrucomicrobiota bacterium]